MGFIKMKSFVSEMNKILVLLSFCVLLVLVGCQNPPITADEARVVADERLQLHFSGREWTPVDDVLIYDYEGEPARFYFVYVDTSKNISVTSIEQMSAMITNVTECFQSPIFCQNFATMATRAYEKATSRADRNFVTRFYSAPPFFIILKPDLEDWVSTTYPGKKLGRPVFISDFNMHYQIIDKDEPITIGPLTKDDLVMVAVVGAPAFSLGDTLEGQAKIAEEFEDVGLT